MSTTTLRLPSDLKERVTKVAEKSGKTAHAFMLEAIEESVRLTEARAAMMDEAQERYEQLLASGRGVDWHEMRAYLKQRTSGRHATSPRPRSWRK